jgi:hypothetical protein
MPENVEIEMTEEPGKAPWLDTPETLKIWELDNEVYTAIDRSKSEPTRPMGTFVHKDYHSFCKHLDEVRTESTKLWFYRDGSNVIIDAVINDHAGNVPGWGDYVLKLELVRTSMANRLFRHIATTSFGQTEFVDFVNSFGRYITTPEAAKLLELVSEINLSSGQEFRSVVKNGQTKITASDSTSTTLKPPTKLTLAFPVYAGLPPFNLELPLTVSVQEKTLKFSFDDYACEDSFNRSLVDWARFTVDAFIGKPAPTITRHGFDFWEGIGGEC